MRIIQRRPQLSSYCVGLSLMCRRAARAVHPRATGYPTLMRSGSGRAGRSGWVQCSAASVCTTEPMPSLSVPGLLPPPPVSCVRCCVSDGACCLGGSLGLPLHWAERREGWSRAAVGYRTIPSRAPPPCVPGGMRGGFVSRPSPGPPCYLHLYRRPPPSLGCAAGHVDLEARRGRCWPGSVVGAGLCWDCQTAPCSLRSVAHLPRGDWCHRSRGYWGHGAAGDTGWGHGAAGDTERPGILGTRSGRGYWGHGAAGDTGDTERPGILGTRSGRGYEAAGTQSG